MRGKKVGLITFLVLLASLIATPGTEGQSGSLRNEVPSSPTAAGAAPQSAATQTSAEVQGTVGLIIGHVPPIEYEHAYYERHATPAMEAGLN